ncbi:membrane protein [Escherichia phage 4MG]|uniref:Hyphothetical protein n=1 Tax=Escherichia phage 4MG TaxID=1391428 RepID=V5KSR4_9CAUD|nr:membrane protein [Escherichia phage 4MG]AGZ17735.1 hyphothetical protein [Escherichia phage 4MG]
MFVIIYLAMWVLATTVFIRRWQRQFGRVDAFILVSAIFAGFFWFAYFPILVILRLINGDWRS